MIGLPNDASLQQVLENADAVDNLLDADPAVLENRLAVLLRIEGTVDTPQKLDYIVAALGARAGGSKGLDITVDRMVEL